MSLLDQLASCLAASEPLHAVGRVKKVTAGSVVVSGLSGFAAIGDRVALPDRTEDAVGRITGLDGEDLVVTFREDHPFKLDDQILHIGPDTIAPSKDMLGRFIDLAGRSLDGRPLMPGPEVIEPGRMTADVPSAELDQNFYTGSPIIDLLSPLDPGRPTLVHAENGIGLLPFMAMISRKSAAEVVIWVREGGSGDIAKLRKRLGAQGMARMVVIEAERGDTFRANLAGLAVASFFRQSGYTVALFGTFARELERQSVKLTTIARSRSIPVFLLSCDPTLGSAGAPRAFGQVVRLSSKAAEAGLMPPIEPSPHAAQDEGLKSEVSLGLLRDIRDRRDTELVRFFRDADEIAAEEGPGLLARLRASIGGEIRKPAGAKSEEETTQPNP